MDFIIIHSIWTILLLINFIIIVWWTYGKKRKSDFDKAANLIFTDNKRISNSNNKE
ncbi:cytochrome c oxidase [Candidatus Photodesmus blepharus]|uniref:Cytochrome c oxidase n=1 Tax=Candidatus Photodesmus blepharonis TaxID=1179155 RepID=A0A084CNF3_9GAMM|nr:CcoQ/FixQ family Cbb3-type cytochrome c oxidase assembly chaperone [Candidatus Photodesmus blepharus]KEY91332.1 cytochrome c oxidase [Candidatus Photodesmus blepharus]